MARYSCNVDGFSKPIGILINQQTNGLFLASALWLPGKRLLRAAGDNTLTDAGTLTHKSFADFTETGATKLLMDWVTENLGAPGPLVPEEFALPLPGASRSDKPELEEVVPHKPVITIGMRAGSFREPGTVLLDGRQIGMLKPAPEIGSGNGWYMTLDGGVLWAGDGKHTPNFDSGDQRIYCRNPNEVAHHALRAVELLKLGQ